jgi:hypothetical protein
MLNSKTKLSAADCPLSLQKPNEFCVDVRRKRSYIATNCLFGKILLSLCVFFTRKASLAGFGLLARIVTIPAGNDSIISPDIFT